MSSETVKKGVSKDESLRMKRKEWYDEKEGLKKETWLKEERF